jgi:hypothetical protein
MNYIYNVVYDAGVIWQRKPHGFPGSAQDFARETLLTWMSSNAEKAEGIVVVNVWDADREGMGDPANIICQLTNHQLDEGPFDPDQINVEFRQYFIHSVEYNFHMDPAIHRVSSMPCGLIAPLEGPALQIRTGHDLWISLKVAARDSPPGADLDDWDAAEQVTIKPVGAVAIAPLMGSDEDHYPDLRGDHDTEYLAIRVSARGRDNPGVITALNPRRYPVEEHLIEAWPVAEPAPRAVLKRDNLTRQWENST